MSRYALVKNGVVESVIEWDGGNGWAPPAGMTPVQSATANIGDTYANGQFVPAVHQPAYLPVEDERKLWSARVDADAENARTRYITPGAGMALTYQEKKDQAVAVIAMGEANANALANHGATEFPTLSASVPIEAATLYAAAQLVMQKYEQFAAISRVIELTRLTGKKAISEASDAAAVRAAYRAIEWTV